MSITQFIINNEAYRYSTLNFQEITINCDNTLINVKFIGTTESHMYERQEWRAPDIAGVFGEVRQ